MVRPRDFPVFFFNFKNYCIIDSKWRPGGIELQLVLILEIKNETLNKGDSSERQE